MRPSFPSLGLSLGLSLAIKRGFGWAGWFVWIALQLSGCSEPPERRQLTLLFTNDFESAYEPTPAFWRDDMTHIGGVAELATLIAEYRAKEKNVFLFDAGDIFTGSLAHLTKGEIAFELMRIIDYDAMSIGNHEFEFGWEEFARQKQRAAFPVLGANLTYKENGKPYATASSVIERNGVRIGVIGVLGQDAATALIPRNIEGVAVSDPVAAVRSQVEALRAEVDLVVVLTHQGPTAPMQTDDEAAPEVYRGNQENLALAAAVPGIDVVLAGHTDAGTQEALIDPVNGTLIMQTWGQGQHLGVLQLALERSEVSADERHKVTLLSSELVPVNSDLLSADEAVLATLAHYRAQYPELYSVVGAIDKIANRKYYQESTLGNLLADVVRQETATEIALIPSGALRKDLPEGVLRRVDVQDMFPFEDRLAVVELSGQTLIEIIEQGLSLERGLLQVSGLAVNYDPGAPVGQRLISLSTGGQPVDPRQSYRLATLEILARGGDSFVQFLGAQKVTLGERKFSEILFDYFATQHAGGQPVRVPQTGRYSDKMAAQAYEKHT